MKLELPSHLTAYQKVVDCINSATNMSQFVSARRLSRNFTNMYFYNNKRNSDMYIYVYNLQGILEAKLYNLNHETPVEILHGLSINN